MPVPIEQEFEDIFHNIESAILGVYHQHPELADYQIGSALESLGRTYAGESRGKAPTLPKNPLTMEVYQAIKWICDWCLGRAHPVDEQGQPLNIDLVSLEQMLAILKRLRKSVEFWNKESGTQGYINYISHFILE